MSDAQGCPNCSRPTGDGFACATCADSAAKNLHSIADLADGLDDKRARVGSNWSIGNVGKSVEVPMPYDPRVTIVAAPVKVALVGLARTICDDNPAANPQGVGRDSSLSSIARWLANYCHWLRMQTYGPGEFLAISGQLEKMFDLFDRPPAKFYIGRCNAKTMLGPCGESLYVTVGAKVARCKVCATEHDVSARQEELREAVSQYLGTAKEVSALCRHMLGDLVTTAMIRGYVRYGKLVSHGARVEITRDGQQRESALYRIGEVLEVAHGVKEDGKEVRAIRRAGQPAA